MTRTSTVIDYRSAAVPTRSTRSGSALETEPAWWHSLAGSVVMALGCGIAAKIGDGTHWRWAADLGTYPAIWIMALVLFGHYSRSVITAAANSAAFSVTTVVAYYAWSAWVLGYGVGLYPIVWTAAAFTLAPLMAVVVWFASNQRLPAWLVAAPIAALILAEGPLRQYWNKLTIDLPDGFPFHPVQAVVDIVLALAVIGLLNSGLSNRAKAAAFTLPLVLIAEIAVEALRSTARV